MSAMRELWQNFGTIWILEQYARWANMPPEIHLGLPKASNFAGMSARETRVRIDDELAGFIHDSINELGVHIPQFKEALNLFYLKNRSISGVAREMGLARPKATAYLQSAESWLDARLYEFFKKQTIRYRDSTGCKINTGNSC